MSPSPKPATDERAEILAELVRMLRPMKPAARALVVRFPVGCKLRAEGYRIPSAFVDSIGTPVSYFDAGDQIAVIDDWPPNAGIRGCIDPDRATLVSCDERCPQELVRAAVGILAAEERRARGVRTRKARR